MELLFEIHGAHVVGLEALHGAGKQSALKTADERLTELAALLLPAVAVVMGEGYDQIGEDGEVDCPCGERHPCECAARRRDTPRRWQRRRGLFGGASNVRTQPSPRRPSPR